MASAFESNGVRVHASVAELQLANAKIAQLEASMKRLCGVFADFAHNHNVGSDDVSVPYYSVTFGPGAIGAYRLSSHCLPRVRRDAFRKPERECSGADYQTR